MKWNHTTGGTSASVALLFLAFAYNACASPRPMYFDRFDRDSGLSQLTVNAIAQDATGFLWVGTEDGFDRFDGYAFRHSAHDTTDPTSLPNQYVADIEPSTQGLWLATDGGSVLHRNPTTGRFDSLSVLTNQPAHAGLARVRTVHIDTKGGLWIGTRDDGLARFDTRSRRLDRYRHEASRRTSIASNSIFALLEDRQGALWVGTENGLDQIDSVRGTFRHQPLPTTRPTIVRALLEDRTGALWVGTTAGLVRIAAGSQATSLYVRDASNPNSLPANIINTLLEDKAGRVWVGTTAGLALFDTTHGDFDVYRHEPADPRSLPDDNITTLFEDRSGLLWIGTRFGGLAKWNPRNWSFGHHAAGTEDGFSSRNIMAFAEDKAGRTWVGTFDGGVTVVDPSAASKTISLRHNATNPHSLSDDHVMALLEDHEGLIWAGTMSGGLNRIIPQTLAITTFRHDPKDAASLGAPGVMSLLEDSARRLWVGTYGGGLSRFDRRTQRFQRYTASATDAAARLSSNRVTALAEDPSGFLWVGTDGGGLNALDPVSGRVLRFQHDPSDARSLNAETVYSIHVAADGTVWVGTRGGGLDRVLGSLREPRRIAFQHLTEKDGLPNDTVYGVHSDDVGNLWVSTNYGIARIDPRTHQVREFHRAQGLQGEEFNFGAHYASRRGQLFFGGANGYNSFFPAALQFNSTPPPIVLTSMSTANRRSLTGAAASALNGLHLPYQDGVVAFEFAALDYAAPGNNTFQYRLKGAERDWFGAGRQRSVSYAKLPGGTYVLQVRAANADGAWNTAGLSIPLKIDPAPWMSPWAYACYAILLTLLVFGFWRVHQFRLAREAAYSRRLERQVRERTRELVEHTSALERANRMLEEVSFTDPLTGLGNRRSLKHAVPHMIANMPRGERLVLMVVDLDRMKPINDEHGHDAGDRVLTGVARILKESVHGSNTIVRWGGDEFVVAHAASDLDSAATLAERMRRAVSVHRYMLGNGAHVRTCCSIGFALYPFVRATPDLLGWEDVLKVADTALYRAKSRRNAWVGWGGRRALPNLVDFIIRDPDAAELDDLISVRASAPNSGETIEMLLRPTLSRRA